MAYNSKYTGQEVEELLDSIPNLEAAINTHNKEVRFFCIEPVVVKVGDVEHQCESNQVATIFVGDEDFEIIPTSNNSIQSLLGYPIPLTWYDWLEGVDVFENIIFDMNDLDTYKHWIQYYQGEYHVQKAQYSNCIFWSDKPYTHSPFEARTNYTIYYSAELPMCYSSIPENTYKPFYLAYGVKTDPNWNNPDYVNSYSLVSGATQTFSYYGATAIGIFDMGVDIIKLPKDCRGLMYHAPAITHAGVFDAVNTTNFGAKKGSWQEAFGDCISLVSLYIKNLKKSINISWSPINNESIEFILNNAANTSAITISVSPYTWYRLTDSIRELAKSKNITLELISTNYPDDVRWENKQDTISDLDEIRSGASKGATAVQPENIPNEVELIAISGDMLADEPIYTAAEAQAIIDAYNANKLIALNSAMTRNYGNGWFIPNIFIRALSTNRQVYISGVLANFYIEHRFIYNTNTGSITAVYVDKKVDLSESGGSIEGGSSAYAEVNHGTSDRTFELTPNTFHVWDEMTALTITLGDETSGVANEYLFQFTSPATPTSLTLPDGIKFSEDLTIEANKIYQISILKGLGSVLSWDSVVSIFPISLVANTTTDAGKQVYIELKKLGESGELEDGLLYVEVGGGAVKVTTFAFDSTRNAYRLTFGMTSIFLDSSGYCYVIIID